MYRYLRTDFPDECGSASRPFYICSPTDRTSGAGASTSGVTRLQWARVQVFQKGPLFPQNTLKKQRRANFGPPTALGPRALHALHRCTPYCYATGVYRGKWTQLWGSTDRQTFTHLTDCYIWTVKQVSHNIQGVAKNWHQECLLCSQVEVCPAPKRDLLRTLKACWTNLQSAKRSSAYKSSTTSATHSSQDRKTRQCRLSP